jgi:hypothetical protein
MMRMTVTLSAVHHTRRAAFAIVCRTMFLRSAMLKATLLAIAAAACFATAASAAIQCEGPYQIIRGDRLATP